MLDRVAAELDAEWPAELGIDLVGGCCGSTLAHIAAIGATLSLA